MRKKIISCLLALAMVFSVLQGTGVPVKADPGAEESNAVTVNAGYYAMKVTDTDVSQRIVKTLDAMITAGKNNIFLTEDDDTHKSYLISIIEEMPTADLYDFGVSFDKNSKICTVKYNSQSRNINAFKTTLDCSAAEGDGVYSAITFCTYVAVYFSGEIEEKEGAYFSKSIDGTVYASQLEEPYFPNLSDEMPYHVPYGGKLSDIIAPELYAGDMADKIESEFVCFPVVTWQGNYYNTWYLDINDPDKKTKVTADTTFTKLENFISVSFTEPHVHSYPATTNIESDYVIWHWGTADKDYKDTYVEILCTGTDCPAEDKGTIKIQNTADITDNVVVNKAITDPTCTKDGEITYTATAKYVENDTTYTYTSTKTIDGDKATGHQWVFDNANAVWNEDNTTVTIKKTCTGASHDATTDGAVEVTVSSSNVSYNDIPAAKCGEASKRVYTATFDSSVDPAIGTSFTVTKTVTGDILLHDWIFDTENAIWEGNDSDGYTKATITKKCKNTVHDGDNNITVSSTKIEKNVEPATEEDNTERTYYTAIFNSENDKDITNEFTVKKVVTKQIMPGCEFNVTSDVVWEKDEQGGYKSVTISKNFINSVTGNIEKTERVKSAIRETSAKAATECEQPSITTYTATFDNTVDPDIKTAFTISLDVKGETLKHNWEYDTENAVLSQEGQEGQERYLITILKTCNNDEHTGNNPVSVTSDKVTISTGAAITCGEHTTITYTATFNSTVDSDITDAFDVEIEAEGPIQEHNWSVFSVESDGSFYTAPTKATMTLKCDICNTEKSIVITGDGITAGSITAENKTYTYTGTVDGKTYTKDLTFKPTPVQPDPVTPAPVTPAPSHTTHEYGVTFNWVNVSTDKAETVVTAEATCSVGGEKKALEVTITDRDIYNKIEYTATATDPNGKVWRDFRNIDKTNNEVKKGKAGPSIYDGGFTLTGLEEEYPYTGAAIKPAFEVVDNATGTTLANGVDYSVSYKDNKKIGTATIKIKGKGNYSGTNAEATFKIVNPKIGVNEEDLADLKGAKITAVSPKAFDYNGEAQYPETITLKLKGGSEVTYTGTNGENYVDADGNAIPAVVTFSGNVNKGTATVLLSGKQDAKKATKTTTVKKTFKINAVDLSKVNADDLIVTVDEKVEWAVKGAQPEVKVKYKGKELLAGQDYKVSYKNNKKIAEAQVDLSGKGNYAKTRKTAAKFTIEAFDLSQAEIIATTAADGVKGSKVKVTILDKAGNPIPASKLTVTVKKDGGAVTDKLKAGDEVTVEAAAKGQELMGSCSKDVTLAADLGKAKIKVNGLTKEYIGEEIKLDAEDMKKVAVSLKISGAMTELKCDEDFEIAGYSNNVKKGTMTVTIVGKGEKVSGSKTFKVKITAKPLASSK